MNLDPMIALLARIAADRASGILDEQPVGVAPQPSPPKPVRRNDARRHLRAVQHGSAVRVVD